MRKSVLVLALLTFGATAAQADNFRCPNGAIVSTGDSMSEVYVKCDPPTFKTTRTESEAGYKGATILISVEEWTYNEGPNRLIHTLTFRNGVLQSVETGGFGK
jgi:hypothetical protein